MDWLLLLLGFLIAVFAAITGVGGGVLFVPLLTLGYGFLPAQAVGTSLMVMVFGGFGATIGYAIQKRVYFRAGLLLALATAPGAVLGAYLTAVLSSTVLGVVFGIFLIFLAARMILANRAQRRDPANASLVTCEADCFRNKKRLLLGFTLAFFAGTVSGLLGIGGGVMLVPILLLVMVLPMHIAVGTSMFLVALTSLSGVLQHFTLGNVNLSFGVLLSLGAFAGALAGAWVSKRISAKKVQLVFAFALIAVGIEMLLKYLGFF